MKTTTRLYDFIYTTYNNVYSDFLRGNQIVYYNPELQFTHKVLQYDDEVKTVCRNTIFYGLDFLENKVREEFETEFLAKFLTRTIKFQTYETFNWRLASFIRGIKDVINDYYINGINDCEMKRRWNYIAQIINGVQLNLSDLTDEQKAIIKKYLSDKLVLF